MQAARSNTRAPAERPPTHGFSWALARPHRVWRLSPSLVPGLCAVAAVLGIAAVALPASAMAAASPRVCKNQVLRTGLSMTLPDCRVYEQVSPAQKNGYDAVGRGVKPEQRLPAQAAPVGTGAIAYMGFGAFAGAQSSTLPVPHLSTRTTAGWQTTELSPPSTSALPPNGVFVSYAFSEDLAESVLRVPLMRLAKEGEPENVDNLFVRNEDGKYRWVNDAVPPTLPPTGCNVTRIALCFQEADLVGFAGASQHCRHILFEATASLASTAGEPAPEGFGIVNLYENNGGVVHLVGVLPDEKLPAGGSWVGSANAYGESAYVTLQHDEGFGGEQFEGDMEHAISADGERVIFEAAADEGAPDPSQSGDVEVYDRIEGKETVELSAPAPGATPRVTTPERSRFWAASANGSRVYFTSSAELTAESNTGAENNSEDLYEYSLEREKRGEPPLRDLTVDTDAADEATGAGVLGVVGAGEFTEASVPSSYVYFVAKGQLVPGNGVDGQPNLYVVHDGGTPTFVATLRAPGENVFIEPGDSHVWAAKPTELQAFVAPDGTHLAFMSVNSLPTTNFPRGYDNADTATGLPDSEAYDYNALAETLTCVSCDPSGAPPTGGTLPPSSEAYHGGAYLGQLYNGAEAPAATTAFHQPRVMSADGRRVFFTGPPFASERTTDTPDNKVYEWEADGDGTCDVSSGCTYRISSARNSGADVFLAVDASGDNVYFATTRRLVATDGDNLMDVYDARVDGGFTALAVPTACTSHCRSEAVEGPVTPGLVSSVTGGSGNVPAQPPPMKRSRKAHAHKRRLAACLRRAGRRKTAKKRKRALRRCDTRYGHAAKDQHGRRGR